MQESKERIKTRMLRNASRLWGYAETEAESNFDPLVGLLLNACSIELEKISGDIHASRARILERLVQLLSPVVLTGALPAHAVATALPVENNSMLSPAAQFYTRWKVASASEDAHAQWKDFYLSPSGNFPINKASVKFMAAGNRLFKIKNNTTKEIIAYGRQNELPPSTLWLAIDEPETSLHNSLFYVDFRNEAERNFLLHHLPKARWYMNNQLLESIPGYGRQPLSGEVLDIEGILNSQYNVSARMRQQVNAFYKPCFINLQDPGAVCLKKDAVAVPAEIMQVFDDTESAQALQTPLRWLQVKFPEPVSNNLLQDVVCLMNCFPVINSRLHELNYRMQEIINIIPLTTDDIFLDLEEITDEESRPLHVHNLDKTNTEATALLMRNGGIGRFDERDAAGIIDYLLQLLRDETAAFASLGGDLITTETKQIQQLMNKLQQRLFSKQLQNEHTPYLFVRNNKMRQWKNLFVKYRSTAGEAGNYIKAGTLLQLYKGDAVNSNSIKLVTGTMGGRNKLTVTESALAYKSALLSRDRLISAEDIRAFCFYRLGDKLKQVEIKQGVAVQEGCKQGYTRTIDIYLSLHHKAYTELAEKNELDFWKQNLQLLIEERSAAFINYRIFIQQK